MGPWHVAFVALVVVFGAEVLVVVMVLAEVFARTAPAAPGPGPVMPLLHTGGVAVPAVSLTPKTRPRRALESDAPDTTRVLISAGLADLPSWPAPPPPGQSTVRTGEHPRRFDDLAHEETTRVTR